VSRGIIGRGHHIHPFGYYLSVTYDQRRKGTSVAGSHVPGGAPDRLAEKIKIWLTIHIGLSSVNPRVK
jgi:hypothetical protein